MLLGCCRKWDQSSQCSGANQPLFRPAGINLSGETLEGRPLPSLQSTFTLPMQLCCQIYVSADNCCYKCLLVLVGVPIVVNFFDDGLHCFYAFCIWKLGKGIHMGSSVGGVSAFCWVDDGGGPAG